MEDEGHEYAMKKFIIVFLLLVGVTFVASAQSLVTRCKILNNTTFQYEWTECYVRFDAPHETIKLTFPHSLTLYVKSVESLSAGHLDLLAIDSDGLFYNLYFTDFSGLVGSPTMQFWIKKKSEKKEAYTYYYFFDPNAIIPILNKFLEKL